MLKKKNNPKQTNWAYGDASGAESVGIMSTSRAVFNGAPGSKSVLPQSTMDDLRCERMKHSPFHAGVEIFRERLHCEACCRLPRCSLLRRSSHFKAGYEQDMAPFMNTTAAELDGRRGGPARMSDAVRAGAIFYLDVPRATRNRCLLRTFLYRPAQVTLRRGDIQDGLDFDGQD